MQKITRSVGLFLILQLATAVAGWWYSHQQQSSRQSQLQNLAVQMAEQLQGQPDSADALLQLTYRISVLPSLSLQLVSKDGVTRYLAGATNPTNQPESMDSQTITDGLIQVTMPLENGGTLQLAAASVRFPWGLLLVSAFIYLVIFLLLSRQQRREKNNQQLLWQLLPGVTSPLNTYTDSHHSLVNQLQDFVQRYADNLQELSGLRQQFEAYQLRQAKLEQDWGAQLALLQLQAAEGSRDLQRWQLLISQISQMNEAELHQWLELFSWRQQTSPVFKPTVHSLAHWFAQSLRHLQDCGMRSCLLLPDEEPDGLRYQAVMDGNLIKMLVFSILQSICPGADGREIVIGYRIESGSMEKLQLKFQYTGKSLSSRGKQVLQQGPLAETHWPDLPFEFSYLLIQLLGAQLQVQELADLGTRLILDIPIVGQQRPVAKRFQNLVVYEPRPGRMGLWRQNLQGVSEQVVGAVSVAELDQILKSRLIDMVVVHLAPSLANDNDLQQLQLISQRYPVVLMTDTDGQDQTFDIAATATLTEPLLLADLQDLPQPGSQFANQQLLIVDDNQTNLSFVRAMLDGQGISIDFAMTGQDALKKASHCRYQMILMDIQLPDLSGIEVTKRIRQLRHHQHTVILAFTGHALPEEAASFRLAGMDDVMIKPLDARKIAHIMSRLRPVAETQ